jgi:hypothetical protein
MPEIGRSLKDHQWSHCGLICTDIVGFSKLIHAHLCAVSEFRNSLEPGHTDRRAGPRGVRKCSVNLGSNAESDVLWSRAIEFARIRLEDSGDRAHDAEVHEPAPERRESVTYTVLAVGHDVVSAASDPVRLAPRKATPVEQ